MFRLIHATNARSCARSEPTTDENEIRNAKRGEKIKRTRASRNAQEEVAGKRKRDRITTEDKRDRKREKTRDSERGRGKERGRVDVPTPLSDRPTRTKPFPPR